MMALKLSESVIAITGASSGIGRATALCLAREGATIIAIARNEDALDSLVAECEPFGAKIVIEAIDVTNEDGVKGVVRRAYENLGKIDVWINDAAVSAFGRFDETPSDDFWRVIQTNLFGYVNGMRAILPRFRQQGRGIIINVASIVGKIGQPFSSAYSASKAAIIALSESVRMELGDTPGVHICTVLPMAVDTPLFQHAANFLGLAPKAMSPVYSPEEIAETIVDTILSPRPEVMIGGVSKPMAILRQFAPAAFERVYARRVRKEHFEEETVPETSGNLYEPAEEESTTGGWATPARARHHQNKNFAGMAIAIGATAIGAGALFLLNRRMPIFVKIPKMMR